MKRRQNSLNSQCIAPASRHRRPHERSKAVILLHAFQRSRDHFGNCHSRWYQIPVPSTTLLSSQFHLCLIIYSLGSALAHQVLEMRLSVAPLDNLHSSAAYLSTTVTMHDPPPLFIAFRILA